MRTSSNEQLTSTSLRIQLSLLGNHVRNSVASGYKVGNKTDMNGDEIEMSTISSPASSTQSSPSKPRYMDFAQR